jgi:hypothetical protein
MTVWVPLFSFYNATSRDWLLFGFTIEKVSLRRLAGSMSSAVQDTIVVFKTLLLTHGASKIGFVLIFHYNTFILI